MHTRQVRVKLPNSRRRETGLLRIYNTLTKRTEQVQPIEPGLVRMYTCGPTVYRDAHIGNLRTYLLADWLRRVLETCGLNVRHVKNITDVGHMRQDRVETGGDKMVLAALQEGRSVLELASYYAQRFHHDESRLNILPAHEFPSATQHVPEMLAMVSKLMDNGCAYQAGGNVYFDVTSFPDYGKLSRNTGADLLEGVRAEADPLKRDPRDFTLWKAAEPGRDLKWDSPWGPGFPGWHIECSAMAEKYLGRRFDLHTGGVDNIFPHHEDEIAQSEAAFGRSHVNYWVHAQHLLVDGAKMAKSSGNVFLLDDLISRGFDPITFRYLCLTVRYRRRMNFTLNALRSAEKALTGLRERVRLWKRLPAITQLPPEAQEWRDAFWSAVHDDLNLPRALAITWGLCASSLPDQAKLSLLVDFDRAFGLDLASIPDAYDIPQPVLSAVQRRAGLRCQAQYPAADRIRSDLESQGYLVQDTPSDFHVRPKTALERSLPPWPTVSSSREVKSFLHLPSQYDFTFIVNAYGYVDDLDRCLRSIVDHSQGNSVEIIAVDNGDSAGAGRWLETFRLSHPSVRVIHCDHNIGDAAGKNIGLKQSLGDRIVILDTSTEIVDPVLDSIARQLADPTVGIFGPYGLTTNDLRHFHEEIASGDADAMQAYFMAFRRECVNSVGLMREVFRFYRNLDIDYCFQFKDKGFRIVADDTLPLVRHQHRQWTELEENQRDELSRKNFGRFLRRWGNRPDLLLAPAGRGVGNEFFHH